MLKKKIVSVIICLASALPFLAGCSNTETQTGIETTEIVEETEKDILDAVILADIESMKDGKSQQEEISADIIVEEIVSEESADESSNENSENTESDKTDTSTQITMYAAAILNVRSGASTDYEKIGQLSYAQEVEVIGQTDNGWYQISYNGAVGYVSGEYLTSEYPSVSGISIDKGEEYLISDFEIIYQNPELPTGCESVALTMLVNYYGVYADKLDMADNYLPKQAMSFYYDENGNKIGPDMENYFVGNPRGSGAICGVSAIVTEADTWLEAQGSDLRAMDMTGISFEDLYSCIEEGTPVMVWVTINMADRRATTGWYTEDGQWMEYATNDHGAVLIGYSNTTVTIADPISGIVEYDRAQFEKVFASRGNQAVILE